MATLPTIITALAEAIAGDDPTAVDDAIAQLESRLGATIAGVIIDQLLDEEAGRLLAPVPPRERFYRPAARPPCA